MGDFQLRCLSFYCLPVARGRGDNPALSQNDAGEVARPSWRRSFELRLRICKLLKGGDVVLASRVES